MNKHVKYVYNNSYDLAQVRFQLLTSGFSTLLAGAGLAMIHPALLGLLSYDVFMLAAFSTQIVNRTVHSILMHQDKLHVQLNKCNFLGFQTEREHPVMIRKITYTGPVTNDYLNFEFSGLPPSVAKLLQMSHKAGVETSDKLGEDQQDKFRNFVSFMADDVKYLIPIDN